MKLPSLANSSSDKNTLGIPKVSVAMAVPAVEVAPAIRMLLMGDVVVDSSDTSFLFLQQESS